MHLSSVVVTVAAAFALTCSAAPASTKHVLHEKRDSIPHQWTKRDRAMANHVLPIRIGLRQKNLEHAEKFIYDVADPNSPNYGKHWSAEKVANMFAPHPEAKNTVMDWLHESGIHRSRLSLSTLR